MLQPTLQKQANISFLFYYVECQVNIIFILEVEELKNYLHPYKVFKFEAGKKTLNNILDGGVAIIDQIICSQAK